MSGRKDYWCMRCIKSAEADGDSCGDIIALSPERVECPHEDGRFAACDFCGELTPSARDASALHDSEGLRTIGSAGHAEWKKNRSREIEQLREHAKKLGAE